jgi:hypothetical protein
MGSASGGVFGRSHYALDPDPDSSIECYGISNAATKVCPLPVNELDPSQVDEMHSVDLSCTGLLGKLIVVTQPGRQYLNKLHRHPNNLASNDRNMQGELFLDLGGEILRLREAIEHTFLHLIKDSPSKQAIIVLGADD